MPIPLLSSMILEDTPLYGQDLDCLSPPLQTAEQTLYKHDRMLTTSIKRSRCNSRLCVKNETTQSRRVSLQSPSTSFGRDFQEMLNEWSNLASSLLFSRQQHWSQSPGVTRTSTEQACLLPSLDVTLPPGLVMVLGQLIRKPGGEFMHG